MKKVTWQRIGAAALAVLVWQAASMAVGSALLLPSPAAVLVRLAALLPDGVEPLAGELRRLCDGDLADLILTTGGTGFSPTDLTPEATLSVIERAAPGIAEAMRWHSLQITPRAMLSRAAAGIRKGALIVNLPGSPKSVKECLEYILPALSHGLAILKGTAGNCAR